MKIKKLKLSNFRSYESLDIDFDENVIIVGSNAQGKTNLLEAAHLVSVGKSFRGRETEILKWDASFFRVEADVVEGKIKKIEYIYEKLSPKDRKTVKLNGVKKPSAALLGALQAIFFSPDEIDEFLGFPGARRRYFNIFISQFSRSYALNLIYYSRALEQRNALLRQIASGKVDEELLTLWDGKIIEYGTKIIEERMMLVEKINSVIGQHYRNLSETKDQLVLEYKNSIRQAKKTDLWGSFLKSLLESRQKDILLGVTHTGPHRDDFTFVMNGLDITKFGSRGEYRTAILALKFSQLWLIRENRQNEPILLLDDVFSELDVKRRKQLLREFSDQQTIITTTDLDHIDPKFRKSATIFEVKDSILERL